MVNNIPGRITQITALATRIRTDIGDVAIPNSAVASGSVIITRIHPHEAAALSRLPYARGDRIVTTYIEGEGTVKEITPIHTKILLDSGRKLLFLNSNILTGTVAVARISHQET
jgi:small-conductance mechanosensitive channel